MPKSIAKESGAIQLIRDWQIDYIASLPLSEASKYTLVLVDSASGLIQAFPCGHENQTAPLRDKRSWVPPIDTLVR